MNCLPISKASELSEQSIRIINIIKWISLAIAIFGMIAIFKLPPIGKTGGGIITGVFGTAALILAIYTSRNNRFFTITIEKGSLAEYDLKVDVKLNETIGDLKKKIRIENSNEEAPYYLFIQNRELLDRETIRDAGIKAGTKIQLSRQRPDSSPDALRPRDPLRRSGSLSELRL
jgi:hypothetical protein